jgi:hypothetical protein
VGWTLRSFLSPVGSCGSQQGLRWRAQLATACGRAHCRLCLCRSAAPETRAYGLPQTGRVHLPRCNFVATTRNQLCVSLGSLQVVVLRFGGCKRQRCCHERRLSIRERFMMCWLVFGCRRRTGYSWPRGEHHWRRRASHTSRS